MRRSLVLVVASFALGACYQQPATPEGEDDSGTSGTDGSVTTTDTTPTTTAPTSTSASTDTTNPSTTATTDPTDTDPTDTDPTEVDSSTTAPAACGDGTADPGELCFDGVAATVIDVDSGAFDLGVADFDDDGALDIATLGQSESVGVVFNDGSGAFSAVVNVGSVLSPCRMRIADGDGDNDPDIVAAGTSLVTFVNDGTGSFGRNETAGNDINFGCGDLDVLNDNGGPLDVVYTGAYSFTYAPGVNPMASGWAFGASSGLPGPGEGAWSVTATEFDFDPDTDPDVLLINQYYSAVSIVRGDGFGNFDAAGEYDACTGGGAGSRAAAVGDLDGDADLDIVTTCMAGNFTVASGNGDGTFTTSPEFLYAGAGQPLLSDLDDDGDLDLLVPSDMLGRINLYVNDGSGPVDDPVQLDVGAPVEYAAVGDLNGDGALDVATAYDAHVAIFFAGA